jgi:hypothetical protein
MRSIGYFALLSSVAVLMPRPAFAYIDPGTISMVIQGLFAVVFGAATAWVMRPWHMLKSLFRRRKAEAEPCKPDAATPSSTNDTTVN